MYPAEAARFGEILRLLRYTSDVFRTGGVFMAISYSKLWNLVRQNKMNKGKPAQAVGISDYMMPS